MINLSQQVKPVKVIFEATPDDIRVKEQGFFKAGNIDRLLEGTKNKITSFGLRGQKNCRFKFRSASRYMKTVLCLTYAEELKGILDGRKIKRHLDVFLKALKRKFGKNLRYLWILEFQSNGNPHFHMMTDIKPKHIRQFRRWVAETWYEIVDSKLEKALHAGTSADWIHSDIGCADYMASYLSKQHQKTVPNGFDNVGLFWGGSRNAWSIQKHEFDFPDTFAGINEARRFLRTLKNLRSSKLRLASQVNKAKSLLIIKDLEIKLAEFKQSCDFDECFLLHRKIEKLKNKSFLYKLKKRSGGFILWSGRQAWNQIMMYQTGLVSDDFKIDSKLFYGLPG